MGFNSTPSGNSELVLTVRDAARYRAVLLAKRNELAVADGEAESVVPPANDTAGDVVDWARAGTEAELQIQRRQSGAHLMRAIDEALARISRGTFGVCEVCKQPISKARLEAVPWTRVCRDCKEAQTPNASESARR
jgi:DnaK suppressor protein